MRILGEWDMTYFHRKQPIAEQPILGEYPNQMKALGDNPLLSNLLPRTYLAKKGFPDQHLFFMGAWGFWDLLLFAIVIISL